MERLISVLLALIISLFSCDYSVEENLRPSTEETSQPTHGPVIDTSYPENVVYDDNNYITVEMAEADLRANMKHECLEHGIVFFDKVTFDYPDVSSVVVIFWFDIVLPFKYGNENYHAKIGYKSSDGFLRLYKNEMDIRQVTSTFTAMGHWKYDDGETRISINFIEAEEPGYIVEYQISYNASYWTGSRRVVSDSDGEVKIYGRNEWDGYNYYLSIDLGDYYNENEQTMDRGYIKVYPWSGVYWDALHANGGPFVLEQ